MTITPEKLAQYAALQDELRKLKKDEAALRIELCDELLKDKPEGTHTFDIAGFTVKAVKKTTISLDKDLLSAIYDDFSAEERSCFAFNPTFVKSKYKLLQDKELVNQVLESKPAMPTLTVTVEE